MLAAMEHQANQATGQPDGSSKANPDSEKFFSSGRTGRRNALPDILGEHARVTSSDLPARLQALTTTGINKHASFTSIKPCLHIGILIGCVSLLV